MRSGNWRVTFAFMEISTEDSAMSNHYSIELSSDAAAELREKIGKGDRFYVAYNGVGMRYVNLHNCQFVEFERFK